MATKTAAGFATLVAQAQAAGQAAGEAVGVAPMIVADSFTGQVYAPVLDGVCGFAWVNVAGNTAFGRWAKAQGLASKAYGGGLNIRARGFGQSLTRKEAYAQAFAAVLTDAGISAVAESRMD